MSEFESTVRQLARKYALENAVKHGGKATPGAVVGKIMAEAADLRARAKEIGPIVAQVVGEVNGMPQDAQQAAFAEVESQLVKREKKEQEGPLKALPNAEKGRVVMRFAPNPSGPATFGHARGMVINWTYRQMYDGKLILRFDDTDATVKRPMMEAYDWIPQDFEWLCGKPDLVIRASDRMERYYAAADQTLRVGGAYVCECEAEAFRDLKAKGLACPHRDHAVEANLEKWQGMLDGRYKPGEATLRVKTDIQHKDPALRDWVGFRLAREDHPVVGDKYRVWPLLDFQSAVDDHETGVTHIIRGKDLMDSTRKQAFLYAHLGWTYPETLYWGRVSVHEFGKFSKSILTEAIRKGEYSGWDDPRLPTLRAMRRRGFTKEGITNFWLGFGITEKDIAASIVTLEAENKKVLEPRANHYFFVADPVPLEVEGLGQARLSPHAALHPDDASRGQRAIPLDGPRVLVAREDLQQLREEGREAIRLKDLANVRLTTWTDEGAKAAYEGEDVGWIRANRATILQWAPARALRAKLVTPDAALVEGAAEPALASEPVGSIVQLERVGFARVDAKGDDEITLWFAHK